MSEQAKGSKKKTGMIIGIVAAVAVVGAGAFFLLRPAEEVAANTMPVVDESNIATIEREINDKVEKGMFETHMTTTWTFPDSKSPSSDAVMGNSASNNYPFWFTVTLPDGEVVYTSSLLPIGTEIAEIVLEQELAAGTYPAVLGIHMVDENGEEIESNMGFNITLVIEN